MSDPTADSPVETAPPPGDRWQLLRDVLVFQAKLAVDALRDVILSPVSLLAALLDVLGKERAKPLFYRVLVEGRRSEAWINLFGEADRIAPREATREGEGPGIDRAVRRVETLLREQYECGGITAQAKTAIDRSLDALSRPRGAGRPPEEPSD